ncbi:hypothetical protein BM536_033055 [Streptomyces phaeoluteigriseus]|uniref:DUF4232 domain-containing protein n=1 Tax=Streptomyces phaeoluteigriseus TaxID=114686 RepID=A0A1V6MK85_9ACTN|nr:hypothetical protein [Streptomyces phaeoluteigriseus]OQD52890.1 hypothetical protein BM536_033055 [Streptomyces phaeoluteigriseus]
MGSMRNPVGPLPSSIYWRRRVVLLSVLALLALLITWVVSSGGGGGKNGADGSDGKNPASSITPGPSGSGPAISQNPGGRDESGDEDTGGSGSGSETGSETGAGDGAGSGGGGTGGAGSAGSGGSGGGADGSGSGTTLPAGTTLPNCTASVVTLSLRSVRNTYSPDQTPMFRLTAKNSSGSDCKVDLGPKNAVLTITQAGGAEDYWSSADCPKGSASLLYRVPAEGSFTYTVTWDRKRSAPECATPPAGSAGAGTYLVEAKAPGFAKAQTSFVLDQD